MKHTFTKQCSSRALSGLIDLAASTERQNHISQREMIEEHSPYSAEINNAITSYEELRFYCNAGLIEAKVTRLSLIREIDPYLRVTAKGKRNIDLMMGGNPPYAYDDANGAIELHHIGQNPNAPFAELTRDEHVLYGSNKKLHKKQTDSWRNQEKAEEKFGQERSLYWIKRAKNEIEKLRFPNDSLPALPENTTLVSVSQLQTALPLLFAEGSPDLLRFIADSANTYALLKELGVRSFAELTEQRMPRSEICCLYCGSRDVSANGTYVSNNEKMQRYKCKHCGKTFSLLNKSIISESNLSFPTWLTFINCLYHGMSTADTAKLCNISVKSAHNNRYRLFYALKILDDRIRLRGNMVMDETYFLISFKGNRSKEKDFSMKRSARKRGSDVHARGLSKEYVCVECVLDEYGNSVARIAGTGAPSYGRIQNALRDSIRKEDVSCIFSDKSAAIRKFADKNEYPLRQVKSPKRKIKAHTLEDAEGQRWVQKINAFHARLKKFMLNFSGVSSDLLHGYLCLFTWIDRNRDKELSEAFWELVSVMIEPSLYKPIDEIAAMPCFHNSLEEINKMKRYSSATFQRAAAIYARFAAGETAVQIVKDYELCLYTIRRIIREFRKQGYAYRTEKQKRKAALLYQPVETPYPSYKKIDRNQQIYEEKMAWNGRSKDFYAMATQKYALAPQTIKNIISDEKRVRQLKNPIYVIDQYNYRDLDEVRQTIYGDYVNLIATGIGACKAIEMVAGRYKYTSFNIKVIVSKVKNQKDKARKNKQKMPIIETANRDKAIFANFLRWEGSKYEFCVWAKKEYNLSVNYIYHILEYHFVADPKRYEMTYEDITPHRG